MQIDDCKDKAVQRLQRLASRGSVVADIDTKADRKTSPAFAPGLDVGLARGIARLAPGQAPPPIAPAAGIAALQSDT
jgi:hypothetical protein